MNSARLYEYFLRKVEEVVSEILGAVTPSVLMLEGFEKVKIYYQFFFSVGILAAFALSAIFLVDSRMNRRQERELRKVTFRIRSDGSEDGSYGDKESALETLQNRRAQWLEDQIQTKGQLQTQPKSSQ